MTTYFSDLLSDGDVKPIGRLLLSFPICSYFVPSIELHQMGCVAVGKGSKLVHLFGLSSCLYDENSDDSELENQNNQKHTDISDINIVESLYSSAEIIQQRKTSAAGIRDF